PKTISSTSDLSFCYLVINDYICDMKIIEMNIDKIIALCKKYKVAKLWVFGSILTPRFNDDSDVDFSVDFDAESIRREGLDWADIFFDFIAELEKLLGRRIDLVCDDSVRNPVFRKELDDTKQLIYG
ncbi:MAG: nucleotidyltransferase domain-containing protein, partial [Bacteroidales bacterium]|nr:nucleotidyltransferase domain-containing protein [Bacteroidales bacterium]